MDIISEIDAKITLNKKIVLDMARQGDMKAVERYSGIVQGLQMAEEIVMRTIDDGK